MCIHKTRKPKVRYHCQVRFDRNSLTMLKYVTVVNGDGRGVAGSGVEDQAGGLAVGERRQHRVLD